jgi:putative flippase GtrA
VEKSYRGKGYCAESTMQILKFATVGVMNTAVDLAALNLIMLITGITSGMYFTVFKGLSFVIAATHSYFWNKYWTFQRGSVRSMSEFGLFMGATICGLIINVAVASFIVNYVDPLPNVTPQIWANLGALTASGISAIWNFSSYKFIVFQGRKL